MNILQAKLEIKGAIEAYLMKDDYGKYRIPVLAQRPILLIGPPGIGKQRLWNKLPGNVALALWLIR